MADNVTLDPGAAGAVIKTDDDGTAHWQEVKVAFGADGTQTRVDASNPLPINFAGTAPPIGAGTEAAALRVTVATDDTVTVDNGGTFAVQVDAALPAGTNAIGKLAANSGVDIGDVDVTDIVPGVGATNLGKAEDAVHSDGDTGVMGLAVRNDDLAALAGTDGDYAPLQVDENGALYTSMGVQSSGNTSTAALGSGATFTGTGEQNQYPHVGVSCTTDNPGTLYFDFSVDGTNWSTFPTAGFVVASGIHEFHTAVKLGRYFRVRLVNDSGAQSYLRLYTYYGQSFLPSNSPLSQSIGSDSDAATVRAVLAGQNDSGSFQNGMVNNFGAVLVEPEQHTVLGNMNATGTWAAVNDDATNLATTSKHVVGTNALTFDKANGTANTVYALIEDTITSVDLGNVSAHDVLRTIVYLPDISNVVSVILRVGTDSSNYNEWQLPVSDLTAGVWQSLVFTVGQSDYTATTGNGWDPTAVTYLSVGIEFGSESDTLTGIVFDRISFHTNVQTASVLDSQVTSSVSTPNINLHKIANKSTNTQAGNVSTGTQRVTIATDDVNLAAIKTATETVAAAVATEMQVDVITMPTVTETNSSSIQTAVELIDDTVYTDDAAFTEDSSKVLAAGAVRDDEVGSTAVVSADGDVGPLRMNKFGQLKTTALADATSEIKYAVIDAASSGDNTLVAAAGAGVKIRVLSLFMIAGGDVDARFESGASGTALTGQMDLTTNSGFSLPFNPGGWFETGDNVLLNLELSAAVSCDGCLSYVEV